MNFFGNRDTVGQRIRYKLGYLPRPVKNIIVSVFRKFVINKINIHTWWNFGRKKQAPLWPLDIYNVSPNSITHSSNLKNPGYASVKVGNWDKSQKRFEDRIQYTALYQRFVDGTAWEETKYFEDVENRKEKYTTEQLKLQFTYFDDLYRNIRDHGFLPQHELENSEELIEEIHDAAFHPPALREITVDIGRSGEILFGAGGQHRLSIAKILDVDQIPVRIRARHEEWQQKRDDIWTNPEQYDLDEISHPDLLHLLRKRTSSN